MSCNFLEKRAMVTCCLTLQENLWRGSFQAQKPPLRAFELGQLALTQETALSLEWTIKNQTFIKLALCKEKIYDKVYQDLSNWSSAETKMAKLQPGL